MSTLVANHTLDRLAIHPDGNGSIKVRHVGLSTSSSPVQNQSGVVTGDLP